MTEKEWMDIGFDKGIIDVSDYEKVYFSGAYREWFIMKLNCAKKKQSVDRIEVTYNKYFSGSDLSSRDISRIMDADIIQFLQRLILQNPKMTLKEFAKIMQIVKSPLVYMRDIGKGCSPLHDWDKIKRNLPMEKLDAKPDRDFAIPLGTVEHMLDCVLNGHIYPAKYCTSLLLCMNFFSVCGLVNWPV